MRGTLQSYFEIKGPIEMLLEISKDLSNIIHQVTDTSLPVMDISSCRTFIFNITFIHISHRVTRPAVPSYARTLVSCAPIPYTHLHALLIGLLVPASLRTVVPSYRRPLVPSSPYPLVLSYLDMFLILLIYHILPSLEKERTKL